MSFTCHWVSVNSFQDWEYVDTKNIVTKPSHDKGYKRTLQLIPGVLDSESMRWVGYEICSYTLGLRTSCGH